MINPIMNFSDAKHYDLIVLVNHNDKTYEFRYYKSVVSKHPKIFNEIKDGIWRILGYPPEIIQIFLSNLQGIFVHNFNCDINALCNLYSIACKYDIHLCKYYYQGMFQNYELTPCLVVYLANNNLNYFIAEMYLNMDFTKITIDLIRLIPNDVLGLIFNSKKLNSLELFWNYALRFINVENTEKFLDNYYKNKEIHTMDILFISEFLKVDTNSAIIQKKRNIISSYLFDRMINKPSPSKKIKL